MTVSESFTAIWDGVRLGHASAIDHLVARYTAQLVRLASQQLDGWLRPRTDPEDILQSVYRTFFRRAEAGEFELHNWDDLWRLLGFVTLRKCRRVRRHHFAQKRTPLLESSGVDAVDSLTPTDPFIDPQPQPDEAAFLLEMVQRLFTSVPVEYRSIAERTFRGESAHAISLALGCPERTVYRLRERWQRQLLEWFDHVTD